MSIPYLYHPLSFPKGFLLFFTPCCARLLPVLIPYCASLLLLPWPCCASLLSLHSLYCASHIAGPYSALRIPYCFLHGHVVSRLLSVFPVLVLRISYCRSLIRIAHDLLLFAWLHIGFYSVNILIALNKPFFVYRKISFVSYNICSFSLVQKEQTNKTICWYKSNQHSTDSNSSNI
jgi:hypothetical protein